LSVLTLDTSRYSKDGPFNDPAVKCDSCRKILLREDIQKYGCCTCGCRRVRNILAMSGEDMEYLKSKNVDPAFLSLFEGVERD